MKIEMFFNKGRKINSKLVLVIQHEPVQKSKLKFNVYIKTFNCKKNSKTRKNNNINESLQLYIQTNIGIEESLHEFKRSTLPHIKEDKVEECEGE